MRVRVKPWDVGVIPRIVKGKNGKYACTGGGIRAIGWSPRSAYIIWQNARIVRLRSTNVIHAVNPEYARWLDRNPFLNSI